MDHIFFLFLLYHPRVVAIQGYQGSFNELDGAIFAYQDTFGVSGTKVGFDVGLSRLKVGEGIGVFLEKELDFIGLFGCHCHKNDVLILVLGFDAIEFGHFGDAGRTGGKPGVDEHYFAMANDFGYFLAFQIE